MPTNFYGAERAGSQFLECLVMIIKPPDLLKLHLLFERYEVGLLTRAELSTDRHLDLHQCFLFEQVFILLVFSVWHDVTTLL